MDSYILTDKNTEVGRCYGLYNIEYDDEYYSAECDEYTVYFKADASLTKALFGEKYTNDNVVGTEISVAFERLPENENDPVTIDDFNRALIEVSPTMYIDGMLYDYDWSDNYFIDGVIDNMVGLLFNAYQSGYVRSKTK